MKKVLETRDDVVFYIKMLPLVRIHPDAYKKTKAIVCEKDNEKALKMLEDAFEKKPLPEPSCETDSVDETIALAREFGITGTPAIVFPDGSKVNGSLSSVELIRQMENRQKPE